MTATAPPRVPPFDQQVAQQRPYLMKFARLQLRNDAWAEDAVSDALLAALARPQAFEGRSQLKTWLVGILKHKILDALRQHQREVKTARSRARSAGRCAGICPCAKPARTSRGRC